LGVRWSRVKRLPPQSTTVRIERGSKSVAARMRNSARPVAGISWASSTNSTGAAGGLDVGEPGLAEDLEAAPAVVRRKSDAEELAHLAVEVTEAALRSGEDTDGDVGQCGQMMGEGAQGDGLAGAGIAGDQGEAALAHQVFEAPAEVLDFGCAPEGLDRDLGRERVPFDAEQGTAKTKGSGSRIACLTMVSKLAMSAQRHWRALNGAATLLADLIEGVKFEDEIKKAASPHGFTGFTHNY
jgi:hypothetical protein